MADSDIDNTVDRLLGHPAKENVVAKSDEESKPTPATVAKDISPSASTSSTDKVQKEKPARPSSSLGVYTVREGDTHDDIKRWYGVAKKDLPKELSPGQKIRIPVQVGKDA